MAKRFTLTALLSALALVLISSLAWAGTTFMTMGTGSPGGVYYPLGGGMSVVIQKTVDGVRCAAESTGASVENCRLVGIGDTDMGMVMGSVGYNAFKGNDPFEKEYPLVALFQMYPAPEHIVTTKDSDIKTIQDLKGKKVSIDVPGSGCSTMAKAMLTEAGFDLEEDLKIANLSQSESVQALKDGNVDACFFNFAYPASAVMDLAATRDIVLVPVGEDLAEKILDKYPYYVQTTIPAGTYDGVEEDILCIGDSNLMVAHKDMDEDLAYKVTKAIFENVEQGKHALVDIHPIAKQLTPENAVKSPLDIHPGALRYFKEQGVQP